MSDGRGPVRIDRVVTRGGDGGETSLADGSRVRKSAARIEAMGALDEANAAIGALRAALTDGAAAAMLLAVQHDLFDLGAGLCRPGAPSHLAADALDRLERDTAALVAELEPLTSFVLPGGTAAAAEAHRARTVVRRAERRLWALEEADATDGRYLNRLSDFLFALARHCNDHGRGDVPWVPAARR